jgi:hypothetical protein
MDDLLKDDLKDEEFDDPFLPVKKPVVPLDEDALDPNTVPLDDLIDEEEEEEEGFDDVDEM